MFSTPGLAGSRLPLLGPLVYARPVSEPTTKASEADPREGVPDLTEAEAEERETETSAHRGRRRAVLRGLVKTVRPHQWVKNLFVLAPMFFHKDVFVTTPDGVPALNLRITQQALLATLVFCLLAGAVYTINDLVDVDADRVHPVKRHRPIASGVVPVPLARATAGGLVVFSLAAAVSINVAFAAIALTYFVENILYSFKLKKVAFLDVGLIAFGFVLRVIAGGFATYTEVSRYMLACTALLALFLGFGKRRHEIAGEKAGTQREALKAYSKRSLDIAMWTTGLATIVTYVAYTLDPQTEQFFHTNRLWMTAPFTVFGIVRFLMLVSGKAGRGRRAESPTQEMLRDVPFVLNVVVWTVVVVAIVYRLRPG